MAFFPSLGHGIGPHAFGWALPFLETAVGGLVSLGLLTRSALIGGLLLMFVLMIGTGLEQQWNVLSVQLLYDALYAALLWAARYNVLSIDAALHRQRREPLR